MSAPAVLAPWVRWIGETELAEGRVALCDSICVMSFRTIGGSTG